MVLKVEAPMEGAFFVTSDQPSQNLQRGELLKWTQTHGYRSYGRDVVFMIYRDGKAIREWRLLLQHSH